MKKKKSNNTGLKVIIVILVIALLAAVGYICYDKGLIKLPKKEVKEEHEKDTKYDNKLSQGEIYDLENFAKELSNNFALYYPLDGDFSKIENQDLLYFALGRIGYNDTIKTSEIEKEIKNYFGNSIKVKHEDIECPTDDSEPLYLYEDDKYVTNPNHEAHGTNGKPHAALFYISSEKNKKDITVNYKILYSNTCNDTCILDSYYRSYADAVKGENPVLEGDSSSDDPGINLTDELYKSVEVYLPVTTFKIEKTKNGYILKNVEINQ